MQDKWYRLGNTVLWIHSELLIRNVELIRRFEIEKPECAADYKVYVRAARRGEATTDALDCAAIYSKRESERDCAAAQGGARLGKEIEVALAVDKVPEINDWLIVSVLPIDSMLLERGVMRLHASYIVHNGKAILFSAPSGTGKSTQAELWRRHRDAVIVNGDRALVFRDGDKFFVGGTYVCGSSGICNNITAPLEAVIVLGRGRKNRVFRMRPQEALVKIVSQCAYDIESSREVALITGIVADLLTREKVLGFDCLNDPSAVEELEKYL